MDVKEKLSNLFQDCNNPSWKWFPNNAEMMKLIDYLIAHGVTVQEWISVKDRLPEGMDRVLALFEDGGIMDAQYEDCIDDESRFGTYRGYYDPDTLGFVDGEWIPYECVTHWQPLPEPPKGESLCES